MTKKREACGYCGKVCTNLRKGWACAGKDKFADRDYLKVRKSKRTVSVKRGWVHVHGGLPYSRLFPDKQQCLDDIAWKAANHPLSKARRCTITTTTTWR